MEKDQKDILHLIGQSLYDKKGFNILALDVRGISSLTDYIVIAEGNVDKHVQALANNVIESLKEKGKAPYLTEGRAGGDWIVIDYVDIMVHLFMPGLRDKYQLEKLWHEGKIVDLQLVIDPSEEEPAFL